MNSWQSEFGSDFQGMRVLVTGATGFIGTRCVHALGLLGADVLAVGRRSSAEFGPNTVYRAMPISADDIWGELLSEFTSDYVLHLASPPDQAPGLDVEREFSAFTEESLNLLGQVARIPGIKGIAVAGSIKELADSKVPYQSTAAPMPTSPYGVSKSAQTAFACYLRSTYQTPICVLRLTAVYGPGQPGNSLVGQACRSALADEPFSIRGGKQIREFLFVDDAVRALLMGLTHSPRIDPPTLNVGTGEPVTVSELVQTIVDLAASRTIVDSASLQPSASDIPDMRADSSAFRTITGWKPKTSLHDGLSVTLKWSSSQLMTAGSRDRSS